MAMVNGVVYIVYIDVHGSPYGNDVRHFNSIADAVQFCRDVDTTICSARLTWWVGGNNRTGGNLSY